MLVEMAVHNVIVHHSDRLHKRVADRRSHENESAFFEIFAHGIGFGCTRGNLLQRFARIHDRLAADELPDVTIEAAELFLHPQERLRIPDRR
jgi:hypothetical protein